MRRFFEVALGGCIGGLVVGLLLHYFVPPRVVATRPAPPATQMGFAEATNPGQAAASTSRMVWPEIEQAEVDAITAAAEALGKSEVVILCVEHSRCGNLALNFDNAFESARWKSNVVITPALDPGITARPESMVKIINDATGGRLNVTLNPNQVSPDIALVSIGSRAKP